MSQLFASYQRPGISVLTVVRDSSHAAELDGFLRATLPWAEEIVVAFVGRTASIPEGVCRERIRVLEMSHTAWGQQGLVDRQLAAVARLAEHEWSLWLPVHARLEAESARHLRQELPSLGRATLNFRLPDERREYATYYRQSVWRTAWQLRPCPSGLLRSLRDGQECPHGIVVRDDLRPRRDLSAAAELVDQVTAAKGEAGHALVTGADESGAEPLTALLSAMGLHAGDRLHSWKDEIAHGANVQLMQEATLVSTPWPWCTTTRVTDGMLPGDSSRLTGPVLARIQDGERWVWHDSLFANTLPVWQAALPTLSCVIPVRNPIDLAEVAARRFEIPVADTIRRWRDYHTILMQHLTAHRIPALFVHFDRMLDDPDGEADRVASALGLERGDTRLELTAEQHGAPEPEMTATLDSIFGDQALDDETNGIIDLYEAMVDRSRDRGGGMLHADSSGAVPPFQATVVLLHEAHGNLTESLAALAKQGGEISDVVVLDGAGGAGGAGGADGASGAGAGADTGELAPGSLPFSVSRFHVGPHRAEALRQLTPASNVLVFSHTGVRLQDGAIAAHLRAHQAQPFRIAVGDVAGGGPTTLNDAALLIRDRIREVEALLAEPFPANSSMPFEMLQAVGLDTSLAAGFEFVDLAIRARDAGFETIPVLGARASYHEPTPPDRSAQRQRTAGKALISFSEKHPGYLPRELLRERALACRDLIGQYDALRDHLTRVRRAVDSGAELDKAAHHQVNAASLQLASSSSVVGLTRSDPRVIRLLGRGIWTSLCEEHGERWGDLPDGEYDECIAENEEQCRSLEAAHAGATIFICGTGPQAAEMTIEQRQAMAQEVVIGVNDAHYAVPTRYVLSAYFNRIAFARQQLGHSATILHMRPFVAPPLVEDVLCVRREIFDGSLPDSIGTPPTLRTANNVALGATHLAVILGARNIVYVGMELSTHLHFYSTSESLREELVRDFDALKDQRYLGVDHEYERHTHIRREVYGKNAEALSSYPNPFAPFDTAARFADYFRTLRSLGIGAYTTIEDGVLENAGATFTSLKSALHDELPSAGRPSPVGSPS